MLTVFGTALAYVFVVASFFCCGIAGGGSAAGAVSWMRLGRPRSRRGALTSANGGGFAFVMTLEVVADGCDADVVGTATSPNRGSITSWKLWGPPELVDGFEALFRITVGVCCWMGFTACGPATPDNVVNLWNTG